MEHHRHAPSHGECVWPCTAYGATYDPVLDSNPAAAPGFYGFRVALALLVGLEQVLRLAQDMLVWRARHTSRELAGMLMERGGVGAWPPDVSWRKSPSRL